MDIGCERERSRVVAEPALDLNGVAAFCRVTNIDQEGALTLALEGSGRRLQFARIIAPLVALVGERTGPLTFDAAAKVVAINLVARIAPTLQQTSGDGAVVARCVLADDSGR